jgi:hypothetical protein
VAPDASTQPEQSDESEQPVESKQPSQYQQSIEPAQPDQHPQTDSPEQSNSTPASQAVWEINDFKSDVHQQASDLQRIDRIYFNIKIPTILSMMMNTDQDF